jgi:hypothetical protein
MFPLSRIQFLRFAAVGTLVLLSALTTPARADELAQNLGPVGPHKPILTTVGSKRVIAFYAPASGDCALNAVVWDNTGADTDTSAVRIRVSLRPGEMVHIDTVEQKSLNLECGDNAEKLAVVDTGEFIAAGAAQ